MADETTPDGYYVDASGAWDNQPAAEGSKENLGPAFA